MVELPAKEALSCGFCQRNEIGIIGEIFVDAQVGIGHGLLLHIFLPGLLRQNLKNNLGAGPVVPTRQLLTG
jgi:hypothetical protein